MSVDLFFNQHRLAAARGQSLFDCADALGIPVPTSCGRQGKCKECMVEVEAGQEFLSEPGPEERHLRDGFRLSCCCRITADAGTVRCHTLRRGHLRIERQALKLPERHAPLALDPAVTREGDRVLLDGQEIDRSTGPLHGLAMDLGTTTVVLRLLDLATGETVADTSLENPQRFGGSDVMARIHYDGQDGTRLLQRTLARYLTHAIQALPVDPKTIYELVVAGNSTMRDLFFRLDVQPIGQSPYHSVTEQQLAAGERASTSLAATARSLGLPLHPRARVYGLPIISGHVGADAAACMLAVDLAREERLVAIMDIGTNTELILGNRHKLLAASCPAGPAFEGGRITCGMPALPGAIERVSLDAAGVGELKIIDDEPAQGICGSGLVDLLSELLRTERINQLGRLTDGNSQFELTDGNKPVFLSEKDINELAQAKGANAAGLRIIFENYGIGFDGLDVFYLAGGFGRHLHVEASKRIGLIPRVDSAKIVQIGNASIEGACLALLSCQRRQELEKLVRGVEHVRLETHPMFFDYFVDGCQFQALTTDSAPESGSL